jgi:hypothetical protein
MRRFALMTIALAFLWQAANAARAADAPAPSPAPDARVKKLLDARDIKYTITNLGNFKVVFELEGGRRKSALISSATWKYRNMEIREILSPAYKSDAPFTAEIADRLLADSNDKKLGAWALRKQADGYYAVFITKIPADSDVDSFFSALKLTLEAADQMEKELTGKDEF